MTYSEVREMYSMDAAEKNDKREKSQRTVKTYLSALIIWLFPWGFSSLILVLGLNLLNAKGLVATFIMLFSSFFLMKSLKEENKKIRVLFDVFSYLVFLSFLLTYLLG